MPTSRVVPEADLRPDVSLITSWASHRTGPGNSLDDSVLPDYPLGMAIALREGQDLLDLYFLDDSEVEWYRRAVACGYAGAGLEPPSSEALDSWSPSEFAAGLTAPEIGYIAERLRQGLTDCAIAATASRTTEIGRRPRFACLATHFPGISSPVPERRAQAVRALRAALHLAYLLGCRVVEAVGGARSVGAGGITPAERHEAALAVGLSEVLSGGAPGAERLPGADLSDGPRLAMELEPGPAFVLNSLEAYCRVHGQLLAPNPAACLRSIQDRVALNLDMAHAMIMAIEPAQFDGPTVMVGDTAVPLSRMVAHAHLADHAADRRSGGAHSSDLPPGQFHRYHQFKGYLALALDLCRRPETRFSGCIAVEAEAANDIRDPLSAVQTARRWLRYVHEDTERQPRAFSRTNERDAKLGDAWREGGIIALDLGGSTEALFAERPGRGGAWDPEAAALLLGDLVTRICSACQQRGMDVVSYTGDGIVGFADTRRYATAADAAWHVLQAVADLPRVVTSYYATVGLSRRATTATGPEANVRVGLHFGHAYLPAAGALSGQAIGRDIVLACRLCDGLKSWAPPAPSLPAPQFRIGLTDEYCRQLGDEMANRLAGLGYQARPVEEGQVRQFPNTRVWLLDPPDTDPPHPELPEAPHE